MAQEFATAQVPVAVCRSFLPGNVGHERELPGIKGERKYFVGCNFIKKLATPFGQMEY